MQDEEFIPVPAASKEMRDYFESLEKAADRCYVIASKARKRGIDPSKEPEMPRAQDLAARVEKQLEDFGVEGVASTIRKLSKEHNREEVALLVAKDYAHRSSESKEKAVDKAVRIGLSVLTEGILVAPLEGIVDVKIGRNDDGTDYAALYFAGPIRSAGGTGQALSVLICDVVRRELGIGVFKPTTQEIERFKEEIPLYKQRQHLQYTPSSSEIELIVSSCPVSIDGEGTEDVEVSGFRNLPRVPTPKVRGGACLVIAEGMVQKASKLSGHVKNLGLDGWDFVHVLANKGNEKKPEIVDDTDGEEEKDEGEDNVEKSSPKYIKEIVAGRPVLSHPSRKGGFRLRYGRARTTGLAATALSPASMAIFQDLIAIGTQIKMELPGKAGAVTPCDSIEGPLVLLDNGDFIRFDSEEDAKNLRERVVEIVDVGEILVPFGEFVENNHVLLPGAYAFERWIQEAEKMGISQPPEHPGPLEALSLSLETGVPLHPDYNLFWHDLSHEDISSLSILIEENGDMDGDLLLIKKDAVASLQDLGCTYTTQEDHVVVKSYSLPLLRCLGLEIVDGCIRRFANIPSVSEGGCALASLLSGIKIMPRAPTRIGARMGRPEKAKERKMNPPVHCLFPVGTETGPQRFMRDAASKGTIKVDMGKRECERCGAETHLSLCSCGGHTNPAGDRAVLRVSLHFAHLLNESLKTLGMTNVPDAKGVQGLVSTHRVPEALEKGLLRAKHEVFVFKDGTCRFDLTDLPLTHFKPGEIGLTLERCRELGYTKDYRGEELADSTQAVELHAQDVVLSKSAGEYLVKVAGFVDELLEKVYGIEAFYRAKTREDLLGHLLVGLAPHTSGGVLVRLVGYTDAAVGYGHPFFHAAKRRNCDGDEDCVMLLMDGLLNFSKQFLPRTRGGMMDAPLVLTTRIDPGEIDKEAQNVDVSHRYPLEFYELADGGELPGSVKCIDMVKSRIKTPGQYEGFGFTHDTTSISQGVVVSSYKTLETMAMKLEAQLSLARMIRAVDEHDTATRIINHHFLPDIIGNMRTFCTQKFRCTKCNTTYRRIPLTGTCTNERSGGYFNGQDRLVCGGNIVLTVSEKSVIKYLETSKRISTEYNIPHYTMQRIEVLEESINALFCSSKTKACNLEDFF